MDILEYEKLLKNRFGLNHFFLINGKLLKAYWMVIILY